MPCVIRLIALLAALVGATSHPAPLRGPHRSLAQQTQLAAPGQTIKYAPCNEATELTCGGQPDATADGSDSSLPDPSRPICCNKVRPAWHVPCILQVPALLADPCLAYL